VVLQRHQASKEGEETKEVKQEGQMVQRGQPYQCELGSGVRPGQARGFEVIVLSGCCGRRDSSGTWWWPGWLVVSIFGCWSWAFAWAMSSSILAWTSARGSAEILRVEKEVGWIVVLGHDELVFLVGLCGWFWRPKCRRAIRLIVKLVEGGRSGENRVGWEDVVSSVMRQCRGLSAKRPAAGLWQ